MMDYFYNKEITLLEETDGYLDRGSWIDGELVPVKTISCDVQPSNRELIFKEYGYYIDCQYRVFADLDNDIRLGGVVEYRGNRFKIVKIIPWDDYLDFMLDEVSQ